jgi:cytochrome c biogenesis protein CcmG/thiol:disulfide interchange protein DsbE
MDRPTATSYPLAVRLALFAAIALALLAGWLFGAGGLQRLIALTSGPTADADVGGPAPDFRLDDLDERSVRLADFRGQVVLINFWATWCMPCRTEMPEIESAYRAHRERGFAVLAIDMQEHAGLVRPFMAELGLTFPALLDLDGSVSRAYRARALPASFLVDRQGTIRYVKVGPLTAGALEEQLRKLL